MKHSTDFTGNFHKEIQDSSRTMGSDECLIPYDFLSDMIAEMVVVFDFERKNFQYIPNNDLILSGDRKEKSVAFDYDFFKKVIHPEDVLFWEDINDAILKSLNNDEFPAGQLNYFSFLLRINYSLSAKVKSDYLMTYVKLKPQLLNGQLRYGVCLLSASVIRKQTNQLSAHYRSMNHSNYSFKVKKWAHFQFAPLSKRQKEVLIWSQQGFSIKETADKMNVANKTVECIRQALFEKFEVNSIEQAIQYATNRRLIYHTR